MKYLAQPAGYIRLGFQFCSFTLSLSLVNRNPCFTFSLPHTAFCSPNYTTLICTRTSFTLCWSSFRQKISR